MGCTHLHCAQKRRKSPISDFRKLNEWLRRALHPVPKTQDLPHKLEGFMCAASLNLNMGCHHVKLNSDAQKCCTVITQWGHLSCSRLPMGVSSSADIFQEQMTELMQGLKFVRFCIDDVSPVSETLFSDHLFKLDEVLCVECNWQGSKSTPKNLSSQKTNLNALNAGLLPKAFSQCQRKPMR
jgi:hypothetical protein